MNHFPKFIPSVSAFLMLAFITISPVPGVADTLTLKDGQKLNGKLVERTATGIKFEIGGQVIPFGNESIRSLEVDFSGSATTAPPAKAENAAKPTPSKAVTIPAGYVLRVKIVTMLDTKKTKKGDPFVVTLDSAVIVDGIEVLSPGTKISGRVIEAKKGGRLAKRAKLIIELTEIELPGKKIAIRTDQYGGQGERQGTVRKAAIGAAIGGIADGDDGARKGAAYGGVAAVATRGKQASIPPGTLIEFKLAAPVTIK